MTHQNSKPKQLGFRDEEDKQVFIICNEQILRKGSIHIFGKNGDDIHNKYVR